MNNVFSQILFIALIHHVKSNLNYVGLKILTLNNYTYDAKDQLNIFTNNNTLAELNYLQ